MEAGVPLLSLEFCLKWWLIKQSCDVTFCLDLINTQLSIKTRVKVIKYSAMK